MNNERFKSEFERNEITLLVAALNTYEPTTTDELKLKQSLIKEMKAVKQTSSEVMDWLHETMLKNSTCKPGHLHHWESQQRYWGYISVCTICGKEDHDDY